MLMEKFPEQKYNVQGVFKMTTPYNEGKFSPVHFCTPKISHVAGGTGHFTGISYQYRLARAYRGGINAMCGHFADAIETIKMNC